ncbi:MAG TPA: hypothetical protein H9900_04565 [Candidatus Monoglobus merdigallinarum]|uniref:Imidazoleglycerol-phosphate dehydratase n=1 Tax=Candidatus Monoglobus merdigallinarum TaxID=2838698 RepID=A0A9D1PS49_9FIRM|nr:hypothetical protein [Candidatus Monoglobus merdigallinarum]
MNKIISVKRKSSETVINIEIEHGSLKPNYRSKIKTPLPFLNHMIEHIAWRAALNISIDMEFDEFELCHLVCEDVGMTLGKAVGEYIRLCSPSGYGFALGLIDEACAEAVISFEDRALLKFSSDVEYCENVEGMPSEELLTFLDGFTQGARCTLFINLKSGENGHHIWEAVFRAVGIALGAALTPDKNREGLTSGVAGKVEYEISTREVQ